MKTFSPEAIPPAQWTGRWLSSKDKTGSMKAAWSSASVSFLFSGAKLSFCTGQATERKDKSNGGTPMVAILTGPTEIDAITHNPNTSTWKTADPSTKSEVVIFDEAPEDQGGKVHKNTYVRIVLVDWASIFELSALMTDDDGNLNFDQVEKSAVPRMLLIGDSISSAMAVSPEQGGEPIPYGILDGYPFVAQRLLLEKGIPLELELVAYPGINLVSPTDDEKEKGQPIGMADLFFWTSYWEKQMFTPRHSPTIVCIALGTNDQFFEITAERFGDTIASLITKINELSSSSIRHVWLIPPFPDADTDNHHLNEAMPNVIPELEQHFQSQDSGASISFRLCNLVEGLTPKDTVDGVHPSLKVHNRLGHDFAHFVEQEMRLKP